MRSICLAVAFALGIAPVPASATPVRVDFSGVLDAFIDPSGLLAGLSPGLPFSGFVEYDTAWPGNLARGDYASSAASPGRIRIVFSGGQSTRVGDLSLHVENDGPRGDEQSIRNDFPPTGAFFVGTEILRFGTIDVRFHDPTGTAFSNRGIQANLEGMLGQVSTYGCRWTAPTQFSYCNELVEDTFLASFRIDSFQVVPESGSAALAAIGLALLAARNQASRYGVHTN